MPSRHSKPGPRDSSRAQSAGPTAHARGREAVGRDARQPAPAPSRRSPAQPTRPSSGKPGTARGSQTTPARAGGAHRAGTPPPSHREPNGSRVIPADAAMGTVAATPRSSRSRGEHAFPEHHQQVADGRLPSDVLVYVRSSDSEQDASVAQQTDLAEADLRAARVLVSDARLPRVHNLDDQVLIDDGVSGWSLTPGERDAGAALLEYCAAHRRPSDAPGTIWIYALSRFGRFKDGSAAAIAWIFHLYSLGWCLYSHVEGYLGWGREDRLLKMLQIALKAEKDTSESDDKSAVVRRGKADRVKDGFWHTGEAPFGYHRCAVRVNAQRDIVEVLEVLPPGKRNAYGTAAPGMGIRTSLERSERGVWVERMFTWYAYGEAGQPLALRGIAARLNDHGITATEGGHWEATSVRQVLENEAYIGVQRDRSGVACAGKWKALIPRPLFDAVQRRLEENGSLGSGRVSEYALTGLVTCARCSAVYSGHVARTARAEHRYYRARVAPTNGGRCDACRAVVPADVLERRVLDVLSDVPSHAAVREAVRAEVARRSSRGAASARTAELEAELTNVEREIANIVGLAQIGEAVGAAVHAQLANLDKQAGRLQASIAASTATRAASQEVARFVERASQLRTLFAAATSAERKSLLRAFVARIMIDGCAGTITVAVRRLDGQHEGQPRQP